MNGQDETREEILIRENELVIEQCADGKFRWESLIGAGWDCESEAAALAEFLAAL